MTKKGVVPGIGNDSRDYSGNHSRIKPLKSLEKTLEFQHAGILPIPGSKPLKSLGMFSMERFPYK